MCHNWMSVKVISLIFFNEVALKNWSMNIHFKPIPIRSGLFLGWGGGNGRSLFRLCIDSDPQPL